MAKGLYLRSLARAIKRQKRRKLTRVVSVRVTEEEYKALKLFARDKRVTPSDVIRIQVQPLLDDLVTYYRLKGELHEDNN